VALVCAGGGITGAVHEIGCLQALEELLDRSLLDFDLYVGVSGGSLVAALLAAGISPSEMYEEVTAEKAGPFGVTPSALFGLGLREVARRWRRLPSLVGEIGRAAWRDGPTWEASLSLLELLPSGLFDNSGLRDYVARLLASRGRSDSFEALRELYVVAVDVDEGEAIAFGEPGRRKVPVSQAIQASAALPGLFRPVRIEGRDYVDGAVKKTAHINLAIQHGADLVVCVNPIVPLKNDLGVGPLPGHLADKGIAYVLDQALRVMLHGRMQYGMERYRSEHPEVEVLLVEPTRDDLRLFRYHLMRYGPRRAVAESAYRGVHEHFRSNQASYRRRLARHGIGLRAPSPARQAPRAYRSAVSRSLGRSLDRLDGFLGRTASG
jgi:NTE family protein